MKETYLHITRNIGELLENAHIPYQFIGRAALVIQQVSLDDYKDMEVAVQWDVFKEALGALAMFSRSAPSKTVERAVSHFEKDGIYVTVSCVFNTTIKTDPYRISQMIDHQELWCRSL